MVKNGQQWSTAVANGDMCHVSFVTSHVPHVKCHLSPVTSLFNLWKFTLRSCLSLSRLQQGKNKHVCIPSDLGKKKSECVLYLCRQWYSPHTLCLMRPVVYTHLLTGISDGRTQISTTPAVLLMWYWAHSWSGQRWRSGTNIIIPEGEIYIILIKTVSSGDIRQHWTVWTPLHVTG